MELQEGTYVSRVFYTELRYSPVTRGNLLGWLFKRQGHDQWSFEYRFRYYEDDDLTANSKDRKSFFEMHSIPDVALGTLMETIKTIFNAAGKGSFEEVIFESADPAYILKRMTEQSWAHAQTLTEEEHNARA